MTYSHINKIIQESHLSPEKLAVRVGLSGMTIRRWMEAPGDEDVPDFYAKMVVQLVMELVREGVLSSDSPLIRSISREWSLVSFESVITKMGVSQDLMDEPHARTDDLILGMTQIGSNQKRTNFVKENFKKILSFQKLSEEWSRRLTTILKVVRSKKFTTLEKMAAYGALFYLITPMDLIPDHLPAFGLVDDFGILGYVSLYYVKRFSHYLE